MRNNMKFKALVLSMKSATVFMGAIAVVIWMIETHPVYMFILLCVLCFIAVTRTFYVNIWK
jgi:hypothetical protein